MGHFVAAGPGSTRSAARTRIVPLLTEHVTGAGIGSRWPDLGRLPSRRNARFHPGTAAVGLSEPDTWLGCQWKQEIGAVRALEGWWH